MKNFINFLPPWVETTIQPAFYDKESGTVLQQTARMYAKVNQLIRHFNDLSKETKETVEEYIAKFVELKDFVDTYFENLDVQEEINNKLDEMVESGEFQELVGEYLVYKLDYYEVTDESETKVQELLNSERQLYIRFMNDYTFTSTKRMKGNKIIDLNNHTLTFNIPKVTEDYTASHGFFNFESTDEFTGYDGNGAITFKNGTIEGGNLSFCHAKDINVLNIHFLNCKNNHILEMCAIDGLKVDGCTFEGIPAGSTGECIQNDSAIYDSFPWLDSESSTYDGTVCRNFTINNCKFINSEDLNYILYSAIGTHNGQSGDDYMTENFTITNCYIDNPSGYSIQIFNGNNIVIKDNYFKTTETNEITCHFRFRCGIKNSVIANNTFIGAVRAIQSASEYGTNENLVIENNTFSDYNSLAYPDYAIITLTEPINCSISGNIFENYSQYGIIINKTSIYDASIDYVTYVRNNLFNPKHIVPGCVNVNCGKGYVEGNTFDCNGYNPTNEVIYGRNTATGLFVDNNDFSANIKEKKKDVRDNTPFAYSEVYGVTIRAWTGAETSATIDFTSSFDVTKFNRIALTIGSTTAVQPIVLRSYQKEDKIRPMTWTFPVIYNSTISVATLEINESHQLIYRGNDSAVRIIYLYNEH